MASKKTSSCTKGILLAGGTGTRLWPTTMWVNKHLLPIFDKPMLYYPLTTLMLSGIRDVLLISRPEELDQFRLLLGDGGQWGINITYAPQFVPEGLAHALLIGADFIDGDPVALVLGDNIFFGQGFSHILQATAESVNGRATVFGYHVKDPERYGVVVTDEEGRPVELEEKPKRPRSDLAVTGLYFYDERAVEFARSLRPSARNELEITDLNNNYLEEGQLRLERLGRGVVWFDVGTPEAMAQATTYIEMVQSRTKIGVAYPEEVAYRMGFITAAQLERLVGKMPDCAYRHYLQYILDHGLD